MSKSIPVTRRELRRAWEQLRQAASVTPRQAPHLLLVFYAVECGLKAVWLRRQAAELLDVEEIAHLKHDLNGLLNELRVGHPLAPLRTPVTLTPLKTPNRTRGGGVEVLHQAWSYGVDVQDPNEASIAQQLDELNRWIAKELQ
jgi:hypothetical protein